MTKVYTGYVVGDNGYVYLQIPDESRWGFSLHDLHNGQIVTPVAEFRRFGSGYEVRYAWNDASEPLDRQLGPWVALRGSHDEVIRQLREAGVTHDDHRL